jgi:hypothetical protein
MPNVITGYDHPSGVLSASQQSDALMGAPRAEGDISGLIGEILKERRRKEALANRQPREVRQTLPQQNLAHAQNAAGIAEANARAAQARTMTERAPSRFIKGLGYIGGPDQTTLDISKMTGAQRQAYLPQQSSMIPSVGGSGASLQAAGLAEELGKLQKPYDVQGEGERMYGFSHRLDPRGRK